MTKQTKSAEKSVRRNRCVVFEAFSRKQIPKFSRKTFAEAAAEGGSKKDYKRYSRKGFAEGVVSVMKLCRNKNHGSFSNSVVGMRLSQYCYELQEDTYNVITCQPFINIRSRLDASQSSRGVPSRKP